MKAYLRQLRRERDHDPSGGISVTGFQCGKHAMLSFHLFEWPDEQEEIERYCAHGWSAQGDVIGVAVLFEQDFTAINDSVCKIDFPSLDDAYVEDDPYHLRHHSWPCPDENQTLQNSLAEVATKNRLMQGFIHHKKGPRLKSAGQ